MHKLELTDDELQSTLSAIRDAKNQHDATARLMGLKHNPRPLHKDTRAYHMGQSMVLSAVMKKIYKEIDPRD